MSDVNPDIVRLIKQVLEGAADEQKIWASTDQIMDNLAADGEVYTRQIPVKEVGVHRSNRGKWGIAGSDCIDRGTSINFRGFRLSAAKDLVCMEDDPDTKDNAKATVDLAEQDEQLARYELKEVAFASVSGSHLNGFFAALSDERPCTIAELSLNGKLSPAKFVESNPQAKEVLEHGLRWTVIRSKAEKKYPGLAEVLERGFNQKSGVHKPESQWQLLNRMMGKLEAGLKVGSCDWGRITEDAQLYSTKPQEVPVLCDFLQKWSGSKKEMFIDPLLGFVKAFVPAGVELPSDFWQTICGLKIQPDDICTNFIYALIKHQAVNWNDKKLVISKQEIGTLEKTSATKNGRKEAMLGADKLIRRCKEIAAGYSKFGDHTKLLNKVDALIIRHVFAKPAAITFDNIDGAGSFFVEELRKACQKDDIPNEFSKASAAVPNQSAPPATTTTLDIVELDKDGRQLNTRQLALQQKGFAVGNLVASSGAATVYIYIYVYR